MELVNITYSGPGVQEQTYTNQDIQLLTANLINTQFGATNDYIESFIYDITGQLLQSNYDTLSYYPNLTANAKNNLYSSIALDPKQDLQNSGYNRGSLNIQYNFLKNLFNSQYGRFYWIKEISNSRTEIKLASQTISDADILDGFNQFQTLVSTKNYFVDFYLNFGNNELIIANNVAYTQDAEGSYLLIKLYEPLPIDYDVKTQLWSTLKVAESVSFNVDIQIETDTPESANNLRGPNFKVATVQKVGQTTPYYSYNSLLTSNISSSFQQLMSYYQDQSVAINVDYSDFNNFIHFSSAEERLNNFVYKLQLIENYNAQIYSSSLLSGGATSNQLASSSIGSLQSSITNLIEKFDPYEYYLYFSSGSYAWPKRTSTQPYVLYSVTSSQASNWLGTTSTVPTAATQSLLYSASYYDYTNKDLLRNSVPQYIMDDDSNQPYLTFLDMIGQHFDNIWIYYKDVSNRFNATNNPNTGISLDLVADALKGLGVNLYTNTNVSNNVYYSLFGVNQDGTLLPPTGSEVITNYVTSSINTLSSDQIQKEIYKRIYHNLPYLLKTRGTQRSIKALLSTFGIPNDILSVNEFGGYNIASRDDIFGINNDKVAIVTGSAALSSSLLHPEATLQYYTSSNRLNISSVEVGFSPANNINAYITGALGYFNIDQYIGDPGLATSASYLPLDQLRKTTFQNVTGSHSVWEYIRLIKYYNNSVFKMIKDFVPARADISTGIIVKSHMLERNKYARNEPSATHNQYSQSIDTAAITGSAGNLISGSTQWSFLKTGSLGFIPATSSQGVEKFTGEFGGTTVTVTTLNQFSKQYEISQKFSGSAGTWVTQSFSATYQNVTASVRSKKYLDLDYTSNQLTPVNYGLITQSINNSQINSYNDYTNPNNPYAELQDSNYAMQSFTIPRYYGSKTTSATFTEYTPGDNSYGKTAAIDKIKYQYAYLVDTYSSSIQLPGRTNAQIKYIIDNNQNVLDLTKQNNNIFTSQNVYKSGESVDISLFDYDPQNPEAQYLTNNSTVKLYEGGFKYSPILFNPAGASTLTYNFLTPILSSGSITVPGGSSYGAPSASYDPGNWTTSTTFTYSTLYSQYICSVTSSNATSPLTQDLKLTYTATANAVGISNGYTDTSFTLNLSTGATVTPLGSSVAKAFFFISPTYYNAPTITAVQALTTGAGSTTSYNIYSTSSIDLSPSWTYNSGSAGANVIRLSATQSLYYNDPKFIQSGSYPGLETPVFPFELQINDMIRLFNYTSSLMDRNDEYRVVSIFTEQSGSNNFPYINVIVDRVISPANYTLGYSIPRYMVLKHVPDETNLILEFNSTYNIPTDGIIFPQYIDPLVRQNSGNVIKSLKQQNLI